MKQIIRYRILINHWTKMIVGTNGTFRIVPTRVVSYLNPSTSLKTRNSYPRVFGIRVEHLPLQLESTAFSLEAC